MQLKETCCSYLGKVFIRASTDVTLEIQEINLQNMV